MIPVDYHLHTSLCGHASGGIEDYLNQAVSKGIREVGFSDHFPLYFLAPGETIPDYAMAENQLPLYVELVQQSARVSPLRVKLGIEVDYVPGFEKKLAFELAAYPFDYVTGSVHFIDGWGFDNPAEIGEYSKRELRLVYEQYFKLVQQAAMTGLFDVMAHPDLVKKFGFRPECDLTPLYEETARVFKKAGVCLEVNSAGLRYPAREIYPAPTLLAIFYQHAIPITLGSDAHNPEQVGAGLDEALRLVRSAGYKEITLFNRRNRSFVRI
ncbi:MAG: histidinol-phosphatase HisJ family protein [Desulfotomaculaceae bacterium]|nr:histidinol-phosphatase HisJ family protein [Desulfotomaculaceae bacterium]